VEEVTAGGEGADRWAPPVRGRGGNDSGKRCVGPRAPFLIWAEGVPEAFFIFISSFPFFFFHFFSGFLFAS
jgi:hypothetical protein